MAGPNQWEAQQQQRSSGSTNGGSTPTSSHSPNYAQGASSGYGAPRPGFTSYGPGQGPAPPPHPRGMPAPHSMYAGGVLPPPHGMADANYDPRLGGAPSGYYGAPPTGYTSQPPSHMHPQHQQQSHQQQQQHQHQHQRGPSEGYHNPAYAHPNHYPPPQHGAGQPAWAGHGAPSVLAPTYVAPPEEHDGRGAAPQAYGQSLDAEDVVEDGEEDMVEEDEEGGKGKGRANAQKGTSDFVRKLFKMLNDTSYSPIVSWSASGESFVVKNMNDFTKHVLPRHFRHSNFASFVRQLNKYDFHKVKKPEEQAHSTDQVWEFKHPEFVRGREDLLENVKRKAPTGKKMPREGAREGSPTMPGPADAANSGAAEYGQLKNQVALLTQSQDQMSSHINSLTKQYQGVIGEMLTFQRNMVQQDQLMQQLIQYLMQESSKKPAVENGPAAPGQLTNSLGGSSAFLPPSEAQNIISSYTNLARDSFATMSHVAARLSVSAAQRSANQAGSSSSSGASGEGSLATTSATSAPAGMSPSGGSSKGKGVAQEHGSPPVYFHPPHFDAEGEVGDALQGASSALANPNLAAYEAAGLRVYTVGTLQPRQEGSNLLTDGSTSTSAMNSALSGRASPGVGIDGSRPYGINVPSLEDLPASMPRIDRRASVVPSPLGTPGSSSGEPQAPCMLDSSSGTPSEGGGSNMLRVRRSTYVPGWAVPPRVLVVDDNDVCRNLSSKFLQVFGCAIDVAVDGVNAVNKMNLEKYDLVLMDIVMPNLDGVSATSLIREFDPRTPIISMTSNSGPNELLNYMSSGMNDILPKPFTKEGLLNMLEKHLIHLKTVQKMEEIPKARGLPPVSDQMLQSALTATAASAAQFNNSGDGASGSGPYGGPSPWASMMGNGPDASARFTDLDKAEPNSDEDDEGVDNPLSGMGFSDEEYVSMLQNLLAAGSVSDGAKGELSDTVATALGVARGEGVSSGVRSKESTPAGSAARAGTANAAASGSAQRKRSAEQSDAPDGKRARIAEVHA